MKKISLSIAWMLGLLTLAPVRIIAQQAPDRGHAKELAIKALVPKGGAKLTVTSPAFKDGADIPYENTQYRGNIFPGLSWTAGPAGTRSYVVIVQGQSETGAGGGTSIHLVLFNIAATVNSLKPGMTDPPEGSMYGPNVHGANTAYAGPHTHTTNKNAYHYQVFALDNTLPADRDAYLDAMMKAMDGHVLASGDLIGVSSRDPNATDAQATAAPVAALAPIRIETGLLSGIRGRDPSVTVYRGVPYAAAPVGDLRFRAPQPPIAWQGERKADHFGNICPAGNGQSKEPMDEDCLFANVWTSANAAGPRRPVIVWYHGAGASGSSIEFDGESLVKKGLVVVTFNRRDGALGLLATPELSKESGHNASGNYTLLDSIAILQWVHKNIAAFGGDPANVTICGESAGAGQVNFLALSPLAKGLFQRAIAQSHVRYYRDPELGRLPTAYRTLQDAEAAGLKFQEQHGAKSVADLRAMPWQKLMGGGGNTVLDGWVVPKGYHDTFSAHAQNSGAFIAGNDRDETGAVPEDTFASRRANARPGGGAGPQQTSLTLADLNAAENRDFGAMAEEFRKLYPAANDDQAAMESNETIRDNSRISTFLWASDWEAAASKPVYNYFWTYRHTNSANGAYHGSEILFIFNNLALTGQTWTDEDRKVADTMSSYWANFAKTGDPNGPGLPEWHPVDPKTPAVMELGEHFGPMPVATAEHLALWKQFFQTQKAW